MVNLFNGGLPQEKWDRLREDPYYNSYLEKEIKEDEIGRYQIRHTSGETYCNCHPETCSHFDGKTFYFREEKEYIEKWGDRKMKNPLIGISAKKQSGKDEVFKIIQRLTSNEVIGSPWQNKKFAEKLKQMVAILINCSREDLENEEFKSTPLSEDWWVYKLSSTEIKPYGFYTGKDKEIADSRFLIKTTPRYLLQIIGTDCLRDKIHPEVWVRSLMSEYFPNHESFPHWVITDVRFPNELEAIRAKGGIVIRINRPLKYLFDTTLNRHVFYDKEDMSGTVYRMHSNQTREEALSKVLIDLKSKSSPTETALDDFQDWDYVIDNNDTLERLEEKVRQILIQEKIIL